MYVIIADINIILHLSEIVYFFFHFRFIIGREKDGTNSEIAQLISQSLIADKERENERDCDFTYDNKVCLLIYQNYCIFVGST